MMLLTVLIVQKFTHVWICLIFLDDVRNILYVRIYTKLSDLCLQLHNLESILGDLRGSSSDFYPDQAGGGGASEAGNKPQGCLDDGLQGKWLEA